MKNAINLTSDTFDGFLAGTDKPVLVDFHADWCGPCQTVAPLIEEIAAESKDSAVVAKLNVDHAPALTARYGVRSIPMFIVFKNGVPVASARGTQTKSALADLIARAV